MPRTLLLADDSVTIQKVVQIVFAAEDTVVVTVDNGEDALQKAREINPDIIVADIVMPKRNGYDLAQAIKSDAALRQIPVLLLSGTFEPFDEAKATAAQANGYIVKPFDSQALIDKVNELTGGKPAAASAPAARPAAAAPAWSAPPAQQPFRPSAPAAPAAPAPIRPPVPTYPPTAAPRTPAPPPVVPSLSPMPGMRPGASPAGGIPGFSVSRPASTPTPPPSLGLSRPPMPGQTSARPNPFAGMPPPPAAPRAPMPPAPLPLTTQPPPMGAPPAGLQRPAPAAPVRPTAWPSAAAPAPTPRPPMTPAPVVPVRPAPPPVATVPAARPPLTGWDTLGPSFADETPAPAARPSSAGASPLDASFMAEAAAAATVQGGPSDLALDVPLEDDGLESISPLQAVSQADAGFDLGDSIDLGQEPLALHSGTLADFAQPPATSVRGEIELSDEDGNADDRLELAAPHEFLGGSPPPSAAAPIPARPKVAAPPMAARPSAPAPAATAVDGGEAALRAALTSASREVIERVVWEVVPPLVEIIVREHVERLAQAREK